MMGAEDAAVPQEESEVLVGAFEEMGAAIDAPTRHPNGGNKR